MTTSFKELSISTQTVMAYANCIFDINNIYDNLPVEETNIDLKKIKGTHGTIYQIKRGGQVRGAPTKKGHFRNQITTYIWIHDKMITIKIFPTGKFHLTGCKNVNHQRGAITELFKHITQIHSDNTPTYKIDDDEKNLNIVLEVVMVNVDFNLGFDIDQRKLDHLLQNTDNEFYTIYDTPVNTSVNIKLDYMDPQETLYEQIIINGNDIKFTTTNKCPKARPKEIRTHTFLVFSSSKVIQSGRYYDTHMEIAFTKFNKFISKNREKIELKFNDSKFDMNSLKGMNKIIKINSPPTVIFDL